MITTFRARLVEALDGNTPASVAKQAGIPGSTLRSYMEEGASSMPNIENAARLAKVLGVSLWWLATGEGPMVASATVQAASEAPEGFTLIPRLTTHASAGGGAVIDSEVVSGTLAFRTDWLRRIGINPTTTHLLTARGDSMEPTIRDGDILLVDTSIDQVQDNAIYVVVFSGRTLVKRVILRRDGSVVIRSDNKDLFDDEVVPPAEVPELLIAGRVMWYGRSI